MIDSLSDLVIILMQWDASKVGYSEMFKNWGIKLEKSLDSLKQTKAYFESQTQTISIWNVK